jgi:hypothetical protein
MLHTWMCSLVITYLWGNVCAYVFMYLYANIVHISHFTYMEISKILHYNECYFLGSCSQHSGCALRLLHEIIATLVNAKYLSTLSTIFWYLIWGIWVCFIIHGNWNLVLFREKLVVAYYLFQFDQNYLINCC